MLFKAKDSVIVLAKKPYIKTLEELFQNTGQE